MPKYFITFVLLAFVALENHSIYNRVKTQASGVIGDSVVHYMRHHHHQQQLKTQAHHGESRHKHKRSHHDYQQTDHNRPQLHEEPPESIEESSQDADAIYRDLLLRHFEHQRKQQQQHKQPYKQRIYDEIEERALRTMPRIWQHLQNADDNMFGDSPVDESVSEEERESSDVVVPPTLSVEESPFSLEEALKTAEEPKDNENSLDSTETTSAKHNEIETDAATMRCPKCESNRKVEHITEEELTRLRIEYVKQQILEKLRLKERPNVSAIGLPKPLYEGTTIEHEDEQAKNKDLDDYYARTSKKFIFLERETRECQRLGVNPSMCFSFKIDDADADGFYVHRAVLWIFKNKQKNLNRYNETGLTEQQTIVVSEVQQQLDSKYLPVAKTIAIQTVDVHDEWMKIDIEWPIKRWFGNHDLSHLIQISCESCEISSMNEMISVDKDYRPFIMVDTQNRRRASRQKRSINCTDGVTECCREKLYISFADIGWGDWIIQPRGYDAYFCRGSCNTVASVAQSTSHHNTFLQKVMSARRGSVDRKPLELIPCCTAKQYSSLQLVFVDSNNTATQKTFPNMVVESCGCR